MKQAGCRVGITDKGFAVIDAIDCGLIVANEEGNYDTDAFEKFWSKVEERRLQAENRKRKRALNLQTVLSWGALLISTLALGIKLITK